MTPPTAEGGALRSQSVRRAGRRAGDPERQRAPPRPGHRPRRGRQPAGREQRMPTPGGSSPSDSATRSGSRSEPGTNELWIGDVGDSTWEEIDRIVESDRRNGRERRLAVLRRAGQQTRLLGHDARPVLDPVRPADRPAAPYFTYNHGSTVVTGETCPYRWSSISGMAFYPGGDYPPPYNGALFFADHSRNCIWVMKAGANGLPDPTKVTTFVDGAANPVGLEIGPGGDIFYVDFERRRDPSGHVLGDEPPAGRGDPARRRRAAPRRWPSTFDGTASIDPDPGDTLTYAWDLDGDGTFGDATTPTPTFTYTTPACTTSGCGSRTAVAATAHDDRHDQRRRHACPCRSSTRRRRSLTWAVGDTDHLSAATPSTAPGWRSARRRPAAGRSSSTTARPDTATPTSSRPSPASRPARSRRPTTTIRRTSSST